MTRADKPRSGVAFGGIGAGWFELRQDGLCYNWNICNNQPLGLGAPFTMAHDSMLFFVVRFQERGKEPRLRLLQIEDEFGAAAIIDHPHYYVFPWIAGVDETTYEGSFPFVKMTFKDKDMPFDVHLEALSSFIPHDVKHSSLPAAVFNFSVTSKTKNPVDVMIMACMRNAVGYDVPERTYASRTVAGRGFKGFEMSCNGLDPTHSSYGTMGITSLAGSSTYYLGWEHRHPYYEIVLRNPVLPNIDDTEGRNATDKKTGKKHAMERCFSTIAHSRKLRGRGATFAHSFVASWHFPNQYAESPGTGRHDRRTSTHSEGHYYARFFDCAAEVGEYVVRNLKRIYDGTRAFHEAFFASTAPAYVLDQVNSNLNTFFTSSWLTRDGHYGILEGLDKFTAYAGLGTTDVAMYGGVATAALFPELDRQLQRDHRGFQARSGQVAHSITRNFSDISAREKGSERLDMPAQYAYMVLRAGFWANDMEFIAEMWPSVKKALEYVLRERDKNGDLLPDMEGIMCSYDNFPMYGVAPYVASQWLAAVAAAIEAAVLLGDTRAEQRYREVFEQGVAVFEQQAWNGSYYRLCNDEGGAHGGTDEGCLADQVIGQWAAHLVGMPHFLNRTRVRKALQHIMRRNYHPAYGIRNCTWPEDEFLHEIDASTWVDQANTAWTGVELAFASFLIYEGLYRDGLKVIKNVDDRYRTSGMYWDHQEFGGHYFRPMSAWSIMHALLGLAIHGTSWTFAPRVPDDTVRLYFACGQGTGVYERTTTKRGERITITSLTGALQIRDLHLGLTGACTGTARITCAGRRVAAKQYACDCATGTAHIRFARPRTVRAGQKLTVTCG
jgi:uncharacterized protein (DUF608 family)